MNIGAVQIKLIPNTTVKLGNNVSWKKTRYEEVNERELIEETTTLVTAYRAMK